MKIPSSEHCQNLLCVYTNCSECQNKNKKTICVQNIFWECSELGILMYWTCNSIKNLSSYCGLVDAKIRASDKYLPLHENSKLRTPLPDFVVYTNCSECQNKKHFVYKTCSESVLSLEFSCTELVIQWTIGCHIVG